MARFTVYFDNGRELDFESAKLDIELVDGKIDKLNWFKKDNGLSLLYVKKEHIIGITRDTRKEDEI